MPPRPAAPALRRTLAHCLAASLLLGAAAARADDAPDEPTEPPNANTPVPLWELGLFGLGSYEPAYPGSDQNIAKARVLPYGVYRGSLWRVADGGIGVRALRTPRFEWDVSATGAFGGGANQVHARDGMPQIGTLVEFGPAIKVNLGDLLGSKRDPRLTRLELPLRAVFDVTGGASHVGWSFEPRLTHTAWRNERFALSFSGSMLVGNRSLNEMFYGVEPQYALPDRPAYDARAGLIATRLNVTFAQRLTDTVRLRWFAGVQTVRGGANEDSPLVRSRDQGGVGVSITWSAWRSKTTGVE